MGRKRKIPAGYIPRWNTDSDTCESEFENVRQISHQSDFIPPQVPAEPPTQCLDVAHGSKKKRQAEPLSAPHQQNQDEDQQEIHDPGSGEEEALETDVNDQQSTQEPEYDEEKSMETDDNVQQLPLFEEKDEDEDWDRFEGQIGIEQLFNQHEIQHEEDQQQEAEDDALEDKDEKEEEEEEEEEEQEEEQPLDEEDKTSFSYCLRKFSEEWITEEIGHTVSKQASSAFWKLAVKWMFPITKAFHNEKKKKIPNFEHLRRKLTKKNVPPISMEVGYIDKETQALKVVHAEKISPKDFPPSKFEKVFESASVKVLKTEIIKDVNFLALYLILFHSTIPSVFFI